MDIRHMLPHRRLRPAVVAASTLALLALTACGAATDDSDDPAPDASTAARATAASAGRDLTRTDVDTWLDGFLPAALDSEQVPGATVAVVHDGEVLTTRGFGWADLEDREPVDADDTLFRVGSVSKVFTATAVMQLVEAGELDLDTDVTQYVDVELDEPVTLRHLLTHTGGFEERVRGLIGGPDTTVDLRETLLEDPPEQIYTPGTVPAYSNYGNALAGLVVQEVDGRPFETYVDEEVLAPLGMDSSSFAQPLPDGLADRLASGYAGPGTDPAEFEVVGTPPAGALTSSASDMARFMLAQLGSPAQDGGDGEALIDDETLEEMHAPALDEDSLGGLAAGPRMTLGWFDRSRGGHRVVEHGGDTTVFHADLALWPDDDTGLFVAFNGSGADALSTVALRDDLLEGFADRYLPGDEPEPVAADPGQAAAMAGTYESSRTVRSTFLAAAYTLGQTSIAEAGDGDLVLSPGPDGSDSARYEHVGDWTWREADGSRTIAARVEDGEVDAIGVDSAFALLPVAPQRATAVVAPVVGGSTLVLLAATLGGLVLAPVQWVRRRRGTAEARDRAGRTLRVLTRIGVACAALAVVGWGLVVTGIMGFSAPSDLAIRQVQLLQLLGLLAIVPAALRVVDEVRRRAGWLRVTASSVVLVALLGLGWAALTFGLLSPDLGY